MADIFDDYTMSEAGMAAAAWDEMFERPGQPRAPYRSLFAALQPLAPADLRFRADQLARDRAGQRRARAHQRRRPGA
jgi:uncharacterized circularly permuted ATP-grasp superfamily protein